MRVSGTEELRYMAVLASFLPGTCMGFEGDFQEMASWQLCEISSLCDCNQVQTKLGVCSC